MIYLPHVDALQRQREASLHRDPAALLSGMKGETQSVKNTVQGAWFGGERERDARTYVGEIAVRLLSFCLFSFHQQSVLAGEDVAPLLLPEALVYRHDVTLRGEDVLVVRLVKRIVLIEQLQSRKNRESVFP